ncbi:MAG: PH domain-containing protein [Planctomycetes bacterium]|nr:PH domain-containing protein [Planctomycetota bacterium]
MRDSRDREPSPAAEAPAPAGDVYRDPQFEQPIWQGRPTWRANMGLWTLWFLLSGCGLYGASRYTAGDSSLVQVTWIFVVGSAVMILVREALVVYGMSYHLTTQRLFLHRGILTRVSDQLELMRIDDVRLMQSITDRLMNTGDVEIFSTDESDENINLKSISSPVEVAEAIRLHVRGARAKGTLSVERL